MEFKSQATEFKADSNKRVLEGYASMFGNADSYGDIVQKGAFSKTIVERKNRIKVLYQHNPYEPIGKPESMSEDMAGLATISYIAKTTLGDDVLTLAREGILTEMSIGFDTVKSANLEAGGRELLEVRLWEYSPVTFAANDLATITGVKNAGELDSYIKQLERLGGAGLKAGRVLSQQNFNRLKSALEELQQILNDAEPSDDTLKSAEPLDQHSALLTEIQNTRNHAAHMKLREELSAATRALRGIS